MNKKLVLQLIAETLTATVESHARAARAAHAEATDEQNKAENKYDTRGLEASYLAQGKSDQAAEAELAAQRYRTLVPRTFGPQEPIDLGALIALERASERALYFLGPLAGGTEVVCEGLTIAVITPQSPMGRQLLGCRQGDRVQIKLGGAAASYRITSVR